MSRLSNFIILGIAFLFLMMFAIGCQPVTPNAVASAAGNASAKLDDVSADIDRMKGHADQFGEGLRQSASATLGDVRTKDMPTLTKAAVDLQKANDRIYADEHTIGFEVEVWIKRFLVLCAIWLGLYLALEGAAMVIPFVFPAGVIAAAVIGKVATAINPATWIAQIRTHVVSTKVAAAAADSQQQTLAASGISLVTQGGKLI